MKFIPTLETKQLEENVLITLYKFVKDSLFARLKLSLVGIGSWYSHGHTNTLFRLLNLGHEENTQVK